MSYEPDTNDNRIRQLKEEIAKIREERFFQLFPVNESSISSSLGGSSGVGVPNIGISANPPQTINATVDTATIEKLDVDGITSDFVIGETITGGTSSAIAVIGDIDITGVSSVTLILVPNTLVGSFINNETVTSASGSGDVDGTEYTTIGRGHLNVRATSIIANGLTSTFEIHYLDDAVADGQTVYLRPKTGQVMIIRRPLTSDGTTGNIDTDFTFTGDDNQLIQLQFHRTSNVTPDGGWIVLSTGSGGSTTLTGINFPILYPKEDLGDQSGVVNLSLNQSDGHYKRIRMIGDISLTFSNPPPSTNGFKFYVLLVQDGTGGWDLTALPSSVKNGASILTQIDSAINSQTLIQFVTADGGTTYHAQIIQPAGAGGADTPWTVDHDANTFDLFNLDKLLFAPAGGFSFPTDNSLKGFSTSGTGIEANVPLSQEYRWYRGGALKMSLDTDLNVHNNRIREILGLAFSTFGSFSSEIFPDLSNSRLTYFVGGAGSHHAFYVDTVVNPNFEVRLNVNKSNVNLDLVTNDIINIDQAQFDQFGGFVPSINHGERRITGGNIGINMNIPKISPGPSAFRIWFENSGLTNSDLKYEFTNGLAKYYNNAISDLGGITFTFNHAITPFATHLEYSASVGTVHQFKIGAGAPILEINDTESGSQQGFIKLFADMNVQTQNINQVDRMSFVSNNGLVGGNQFAIAGDFPVGRGFQFNVPLSKQFRFSENDIPIMQLTNGLLEMKTTVFEPDPSISTHQLFLPTHSLGTSGMGDGVIRVVNNGGSFDVMVGTGGFIRNLTNPGTTSFIGFTADADLNMGTFNIFNVDVIRYAIDSGVIGFGEYGSAVDSANTKLKWSVPSGKLYEWQVNLDRIADLRANEFHMRTSPLTTHPFITTDGSFLLAVSHTNGTAGMLDGEFRKVGTDVIVRTGGNDVNLSAGGVNTALNYIWTGNHNFNGALLTIGDSTSDTITINSRINSNLDPISDATFTLGTASRRWLSLFVSGNSNLNTATFAGVVDHFANIDMNNFRINNVSDPLLPQDVATRAYVLANAGSVDTSANFTWTGNHNFNGTLLTIGNATSDALTINSRINSSLVPISDNVFDLGLAGNRWRALFLSGNLNANTATFTGVVDHFSNIDMNLFKITNHATPTVASDVATKGYVDSVGGVSLSGNNTWTGTQTFNNIVVADPSPVFFANSIAITAIVGTAVNLNQSQTITGNKTFNGAVDVNGAFSANGSINFSGSGRPSSGGFVSSGATLTQLINAHNTMRAGLVSLGLLSP